MLIMLIMLIMLFSPRLLFFDEQHEQHEQKSLFSWLGRMLLKLLTLFIDEQLDRELFPTEILTDSETPWGESNRVYST